MMNLAMKGGMLCEVQLYARMRQVVRISNNQVSTLNADWSNPGGYQRAEMMCNTNCQVGGTSNAIADIWEAFR